MTIAATKPVGPGHNRPDLKCHHLVTYGLTCDEYEAMRARAGGHCELCKVDEKQTSRGFLVVDHFHGRAVGASFIRGLLCDWCNKSVMQAHDGIKAWGATNRPYRDAAREYERNSWQQPSEFALHEMAARTEKLPVVRTFTSAMPPPAPPWHCPPQYVSLPLRKGPKMIARILLRHLTGPQISRLIELLSEEI